MTQQPMNQPPERVIIVQTGGGGIMGQLLPLVVVGGVAAGAVWYFTRRKGTNPADIRLDEVVVRTPEGLPIWEEGMTDVPILGGVPLIADIAWTNMGAKAVAPQFQFALRRTGATATWQEGPKASSPSVAPGVSVVTSATSITVPKSWPNTTTIDLKLMLIGLEGAWWLREDVLTIASEAEAFVEVLGVEIRAEGSYAP